MNITCVDAVPVPWTALAASDVTEVTGGMLVLTAPSVVGGIEVDSWLTVMVTETSVVASENPAGWIGTCTGILSQESIRSPKSSARSGFSSILG